MITQEPDKSLDPVRLEREIVSFRQEAISNGPWHFRETYVDRATLDPFYILDFTNNVEDPGDDLYDQELFDTSHSSLRGVCITREAKHPGGNFWRPIQNNELVDRLEHFLTMYQENYLQPPGYKGDDLNPEYRHQRFDKKRFIYRINSPLNKIVGLGPKMFAGQAYDGALCGQVTDGHGIPQNGAIVELLSKDSTETRITNEDGLFWFSKAPTGISKIRVKDKQCQIRIPLSEAFGNISGWISGPGNDPLQDGLLEFVAPDGIVFSAHSNFTGKFQTRPLPAFPVQNSPLTGYPYMMKVPDFLFSTQKSVIVSNAVLGGKVCDERGAPQSNVMVVLKKDGVKIDDSRTGTDGSFMFTQLTGGRYLIEVPGGKIMVSTGLEGNVKGTIKQGKGITFLNLIVKGENAYKERTDVNGNFVFENAAPGTYLLDDDTNKL